jgi:uncharacterized protein (TIGR03067 family)
LSRKIGFIEAPLEADRNLLPEKVMQRILTAVVLTCLSIGALFAGPGEQDKLTGRWKVKSITVDGVDSLVPGLPGIWEIAKGKIVYPGTDDVDEFTVDTSKSPAHIDFRNKRPGFPEVLSRGIYRIEGDRLTINFHVEDKNRPTTFESVAGSGYRLIVVERIKK